jgi:hypothetical protein
MCDVGLAAQGFGALTSAAGAFYTASGQRTALRSEAYMAELNARLADDEGRLARQAGEQAIVAQRLRTGQIKSGQRVAIAAGGADLGVGSAAAQLASTEIMGEIDALTIDANAIRSQGNARIQATDYRNKARTARMTADAISPFMAAAISLGTSVTNYAAREMGAKNRSKAGRGARFDERLALGNLERDLAGLFKGLR